MLLSPVHDSPREAALRAACCGCGAGAGAEDGRHSSGRRRRARGDVCSRLALPFHSEAAALGLPQSFDPCRHFVAGRRFPGEAGTGMSQHRIRTRFQVISWGPAVVAGARVRRRCRAAVRPAAARVRCWRTTAALRAEERWAALPKHVAGFAGENAAFILSCAGGRVKESNFAPNLIPVAAKIG